MSETLQFTPLECAFIRRLSIFVASFSREATAAAAIEGDTTPEMTDHALEHLIAQDVVTVDTYDNEMRYRPPDALRATAYEQLMALGEADGVYHRVLAFYLDELTQPALDI